MKLGRIIAAAWTVVVRHRTMLNVMLGALVLSLPSQLFYLWRGPQFPQLPNGESVLFLGLFSAVLGLTLGPWLMASLFQSLPLLIEDRPVPLGDFFRLGLSGYKRAFLLLLATLVVSILAFVALAVLVAGSVVLFRLVAASIPLGGKILAAVAAVLLAGIAAAFSLWLLMVLQLIPAVGMNSPAA